MNGAIHEEGPLSPRQLATILCALFAMQDRFDGFPSRQCHAPRSAECDHFASEQPLTPDELFELRTRLGDCLERSRVVRAVLPATDSRSSEGAGRGEPWLHRLTLSDDDWRNGGTGEDHLTMILVINGTYHHLEAIRVIEDDHGQKAASEEFAETFDAMFQIGGEGAFDTVTIRGAEYVLVVTPFQ